MNIQEDFPETLVLGTYTLHGVTFNVGHEHLVGSANVFNPTYLEFNEQGIYSYKREMIEFVARTSHLKEFVDIGAEAGVFSMMFTSTPDKHAFAIEPSPWGYKVLVENCNANPERHITPIQAFIGNKPGEPVHVTKCHTHCIADQSGGDAWHRKYYGKSLERDQATILCFRLDDITAISESAVDCVKIDVEGYECEVLRGMQNVMSRQRPLIFLEAHTGVLPGHGESSESLLALIHGYNYRVENYDGVEQTDFLDAGFKRVLCVPR